VMVISDAPVGPDLSGGPQALWPDNPLAPESASVGRTQLAPDRPPLSRAQPPHHGENPLAAATLTSPPGAGATFYRSNTQPGIRFFWGADSRAEILHRPTKVTEKIRAEVRVQPKGARGVFSQGEMEMKRTVARGGFGWPLGVKKGMEIPKTRGVEI